MNRPPSSSSSSRLPLAAAALARSRRLQRAVLLLATLGAGAAGCGRGTPAAQGADAAASAGRPAPSGPKAVEIQEDPVKTGIETGDAGLAGRVRARLAGDPQLRSLHIEVAAEGGRVTLWGHVDRAEDRAAVEQMARRTPGVGGVTDLIKVDTAGAAPPS
jgi:osmotically-inducible protein OsmY